MKSFKLYSLKSNPQFMGITLGNTPEEKEKGLIRILKKNGNKQHYITYADSMQEEEEGLQRFTSNTENSFPDCGKNALGIKFTDTPKDYYTLITHHKNITIRTYTYCPDTKELSQIVENYSITPKIETAIPSLFFESQKVITDINEIKRVLEKLQK